jgi:antitoxin (DNA-binding transcriptional repressor) of toxin-antitoxin stability system
MPFVTITEAQARLPELIAALLPGEQLFITQDHHVIAKLVSCPARSREPRQPGSAIGILSIIEDDDAHLADFKEYME